MYFLNVYIYFFVNIDSSAHEDYYTGWYACHIDTGKICNFEPTTYASIPGFYYPAFSKAFHKHPHTASGILSSIKLTADICTI